MRILGRKGLVIKSSPPDCRPWISSSGSFFAVRKRIGISDFFLTYFDNKYPSPSGSMTSNIIKSIEFLTKDSIPSLMLYALYIFEKPETDSISLIEWFNATSSSTTNIFLVKKGVSISMSSPSEIIWIFHIYSISKISSKM